MYIFSPSKSQLCGFSHVFNFTLADNQEHNMWETDWNLWPSSQQIVYYMQMNNTALHSYLYLSVLSYFFVNEPVQKNVTLHTKQPFFFSVSKCLQKPYIKESVFSVKGSAFSCFSLGFLSCTFCDSEGASISEDLPHPYQWLPFIWCHWQCMQFLVKMKKLEMGNWNRGINWNGSISLGAGKQCAHRGIELLWRAEEIYVWEDTRRYQS